MAEAERSGLTGAITESELGMPIMPHTALSQDQLDLLYPAITAPDEIDDPDLSRDDQDLTYTNGMGIAAGITKDMVAYGRTRREGDRRGCNGTLSKDGAEGQSHISSGLLTIALVVDCLAPAESPASAKLGSVDAAVGLPRVGCLAPAESLAAPKLGTADAASNETPREAPPSGSHGDATLCGLPARRVCRL